MSYSWNQDTSESDCKLTFNTNRFRIIKAIQSTIAGARSKDLVAMSFTNEMILVVAVLGIMTAIGIAMVGSDVEVMSNMLVSIGQMGRDRVSEKVAVISVDAVNKKIVLTNYGDTKTGIISVINDKGDSFHEQCVICELKDNSCRNRTRYDVSEMLPVSPGLSEMTCLTPLKFTDKMYLVTRNLNVVEVDVE